MGNIYRKYFVKKSVTVLIMGLDGAGKTSMLYRQKLGYTVSTITTGAFNVEELIHNNVELIAWDIGGGDKVRILYRHYIPEAGAVIFLVDSTDQEKMSQVKDELHKLLGDYFGLRDAPVLILANKQDKPEAMTPEKLSEELELEQFSQRQLYTCGSCANTGEGIQEGLDWLTEQLARPVPSTSIQKQTETSWWNSWTWPWEDKPIDTETTTVMDSTDSKPSQ